ncbi:hypothetical protein IAR50_005908 [Cryptococcus sp. DSM 104548]
MPDSAASSPLFSVDGSPPSSPRNSLHATVRHVYNQTHRDFYAWKPPSTLSMETGWAQKRTKSIDKKTVQAHNEFGRKVARALKESTGGSGTKPVFRGDEKLAVAKRHAKAIISWNNTVLNPLPPPETYVSHSKVKPVPKYFYCVPVQRTILSPDMVILPFVPTFTDDVRFNSNVYTDEFPQCAWELPGRDGDTDIILCEAAKRCRAKGLSAADINMTRVLPKDIVDIEMLDLMRDLPAFPYPPETYLTSPERDTRENDLLPAKRKWVEPLEVKQEDYPADPADFEEICCHNLNCTNFMCVTHTALHFDNLLRRTTGDDFPFAEDKLKRLPLLPDILPNLNNNCSDTCYSLRVSELLTETGEERQNHPRKSWEQWEQIQLIQILKSWDEADIGLCALRDVFDRPCDDIALEVVAITKAQPELPADDNNNQNTSKTRSRPLAFPITNTLPNFEKCAHDGPCSNNICVCAKTKWPCGRTCSCSVDCVRRFRGCRCRKIAKQKGKNVTRACQPSKCPCIKNYRECDRELCGPCGAADELLLARDVRAAGGTFGVDGDWKAANGLTKSKYITCGNVAMQKGVTPKMRVGISEIAGYGLFADQDIPKNTMIGEYVGELISDWEGDMRNATENIVQRRYQFQVNKDSIIDAAFYGNLTRYFNSDTGPKVNCQAEHRSVDHTPRIIFTTLRAIKRHEEILFNYGQVKLRSSVARDPC